MTETDPFGLIVPFDPALAVIVYVVAVSQIVYDAGAPLAGRLLLRAHELFISLNPILIVCERDVNADRDILTSTTVAELDFTTDVVPWLVQLHDVPFPFALYNVEFSII